MIIPIGFGKSLPHRPWLSWSICILIACCSIFHFQKIENLEKGIQESQAAKNYYLQQVEFSKNNCMTISGLAKGCQLVQKILLARAEDLNENEFNPETDGVDPTVIKSLKSNERKFVTDWLAALQNPKRFERIVGIRIKDMSPLFQATQSFKEFEMHEFARLGLLTPESRSLFAGVISFFSHGGWMHLVGNLVVLFFFLRMLEPRYPRMALLFLLVGGGVFGLYCELWMQSKELPAILGASAGVTTMIGCFWITYFHRQVRVIFLEPTTWLTRRKIYIPVSWVVPTLVLLVDFIGALNDQIEGTGVAHWAHVSGFLVGAIGAKVLMALMPLPDGVLFPRELEYLIKIKKAQENSKCSVQNIIDMCEEVLDWNPDQIYALKVGLSLCFRKAVNETHFLETRFPEFLTICQRRKWERATLEVLAVIPKEYNFSKLLARLPLPALRWLGRILQESGQWWRALLCYTLIAEKFAKKKSSAPIYMTIKDLVTLGMEKPGSRVHLQSWMASLKHPLLKKLIERDFPEILQVTKEFRNVAS